MIGHERTGHIIVLSSAADERARYDRLEESLFHEAAHAFPCQAQRLADDWKRVQAGDARFLTSYTAQSPGRVAPEDTEAATMHLAPQKSVRINRLFPPDERGR